MADYVRRTILSQSYSHIEKVHLTDQEKKDFELDLLTYQQPRAKILLGANIIPEVKTKDGSLIVYTTVYGSLSDALGKHEDFQKSLALLYGSSKMLADGCILESLFFSKATKQKLLRAEARTGVVKSTKNLFDMVVKQSETRQTESHKKLLTYLDNLEKKIAFLDRQLEYARDRQLVWSNFHPLLLKLKSVFYKLPTNPNDDRLKEYKGKIDEMIEAVRLFSLAQEDRNLVDVDPTEIIDIED